MAEEEKTDSIGVNTEPAVDGVKVDANNKAGDENIIAALSYFMGWLTGIPIYLIYKEKSKFASFHAVQSTIVFGGLTVLNILLGATLIGLILVPFIGLAGMILWIFLMYKAYSGEKYMLPYIGELSEKYA